MSPYGDMFSSTNKSIPSLVGSKDSSTDSPMGFLNSGDSGDSEFQRGFLNSGDAGYSGDSGGNRRVIPVIPGKSEG